MLTYHDVAKKLSHYSSHILVDKLLFEKNEYIYAFDDVHFGSVFTNVFQGDTLGLELKVIHCSPSNLKLKGRFLHDGLTVFSPIISLRMKERHNDATA